MTKLKVCWISAGISSFMAEYLAGNVDKWIYIDIPDQHKDSIRFIKDCEKAISKKIQIVKSNELKIALERLVVLEIHPMDLHHVQTGLKRE